MRDASVMSLEISLFNSFFSSPLFLASGIHGSTISSLRRIYNSGAALVVSKSIGTSTNEGYSLPIITGSDHYLINSVGLSNPGIEQFVHEALSTTIDFPFVGSIFAKDEIGFSTLAQKMESIAATGVELNISCPHAKKGLGISISSDLDLVGRIVKKTVDTVSIPVCVKIPPILDKKYLHDLVGTIDKLGAKAIVATNTAVGMAIDIYRGSPILSNISGGVSGPALKPIALSVVFDIKKEFDIPVIGVGGITTGCEVIEFMQAGASAVQIGSALYYRGYDVFNKIKEELHILLDDLGCSSIKDVIGRAQKN